MREVADEVAADGFEAAEAGQVLDEQQASARVPVGDDHELQVLVARGHLDGFALHLARLLAAPPGFDKLMVADHLGNAAIERAGGLEQPARGGIGKLHQPGFVGDQHAIRDLVEEGGEAGAFCLQIRMLKVEG